MFTRVLTSGLLGLEAEETWAEVDVSFQGFPKFSIVGLANKAVMEASERIHSAIENCGYDFPDNRVTVNLTPASRPKEGSHYDLAIAAALLIGSRQIKDDRGELENTALLGELSLDGRINPVEGVLPMVIGMHKNGIKRVMVPTGNLMEAMLVKGMEIIPFEHLKELTGHIDGSAPVKSILADGNAAELSKREAPDFRDIRGQEQVKRAAQLAAAGMHGLLMIGPPGVGKTMVGKRIPGIMPPMTFEEKMDVTRIYSVAGELNPQRPVIVERPFRAPHHSMSAVSLVGGGGSPRPGEISLAHCGVLFLDELPEFSPHTLDMLRQPLEDKYVSIARVMGRCVFPSDFMLVAAMNPCRCGYYGDPVKQCTCTETDRRRYIGHVSGPLLDRIDIHVAMDRVSCEDIMGTPDPACCPQDSETLRKGVILAVEMQKERYKDRGLLWNSALDPAGIKRWCALDKASRDLMAAAFKKYTMSARVYNSVLKLARTAADTCGSESIKEEHILEALSYRKPEKYFGGR